MVSLSNHELTALRKYLKTSGGCPGGLSALPFHPHPNRLQEGEGTCHVPSKR